MFGSFFRRNQVNHENINLKQQLQILEEKNINSEKLIDKIISCFNEDVEENVVYRKMVKKDNTVPVQIVLRQIPKNNFSKILKYSFDIQVIDVKKDYKNSLDFTVTGNVVTIDWINSSYKKGIGTLMFQELINFSKQIKASKICGFILPYSRLEDTLKVANFYLKMGCTIDMEKLEFQYTI